MIKGYDLDSNQLTFTKNLTIDDPLFSGLALFATMSPTSIYGGTNYDYKLPIVFAEPTTNSAADQVNFQYIYGAGFNEADFGAQEPEEPVDT